MKQLFTKKFGKKITIKPCSSDQIGCDYHLDLFGASCPSCPHQPSNKTKFFTFGAPKSAPLVQKQKAQYIIVIWYQACPKSPKQALLCVLRTNQLHMLKKNIHNALVIYEELLRYLINNFFVSEDSSTFTLLLPNKASYIQIF